MPSKILVLVLIVTICKVESHPTSKGYQNPPSNGKSQGNSQSQATAVAAATATSTQSGSNQNNGYTKPRQTQQTVPTQTAAGSTGIVASPRLQIVPGQGSIQTIPLSQLTGLINQQRGQACGYNGALPGIQAGQIPQLQVSPLSVTPPCLGLKPSLCGPSSVITGPVSAITIPPSPCATVIDNSMCNSLANALQMLIANELINSAGCSNLITSDGLPLATETVLSGVDLNSVVQTGSQICSQAEPIPQTSSQGYYDWATILNFLNQQNEPQVQPQTDCGCVNAELAALVNYLTQNGGAQQQSVPSQQSCTQGASGNAVIDALAGYLGCSPSQVSSCSYPNTPEIQFPVEIPAQLVCNYGYMPTTVPVVQFSVQPLSSDGFIIGSQC